MSNELNRPRILRCPSDNRTAAPSFDELANTNLSYFVGVDAQETRPQMLLAGDRNLTNGLPRPMGVMGMEPDRPLGWTAEMHVEQGNVGLSDGSVQQMNTAVLRRQIEQTRAHTDVPDKRLQFPD
jgi:hypothetical protein